MINQLSQYDPIFISFKEKIKKTDKVSNDLYCTAISRSIKTKKKIIIDCRQHKCAGGNYFIGQKTIPIKEIQDVYVKKECVFKNKQCANKFLCRVKRNTKKSNYIIFNPEHEAENEIVLLIMNAENTGRVLGILAYSGGLNVDIIPAISTCSSIFRPLKNNTIHVNFIDYYDRQYQAKGFFLKDEILISMTYKMYSKLNKIYRKSPHGKKPIIDMEIYNINAL